MPGTGTPMTHEEIKALAEKIRKEKAKKEQEK